jgi:hypothetical protein
MGIIGVFGTALEAAKGSWHLTKTAMISIPMGFLSLFIANMDNQVLPTGLGSDSFAASVAV